MRIYKYNFNRQGKPGQRKLVFLGQHEPEINSGVSIWGSDVEIEVERETTAFIVGLTTDEAKKIRRYLDKMGL